MDLVQQLEFLLRLLLTIMTMNDEVKYPVIKPDSQWLAWRNKVDSLEYTEAAHYQQDLFDNVIMQIN